MTEIILHMARISVVLQSNLRIKTKIPHTCRKGRPVQASRINGDVRALVDRESASGPNRK